MTLADDFATYNSKGQTGTFGGEVSAALRERDRLREALERIEDGAFNPIKIAREALNPKVEKDA